MNFSLPLLLAPNLSEPAFLETKLFHDIRSNAEPHHVREK